jgi:hypothetical protein
MMNEQIKLLAEQAGLKVESFMTNPPKPFQILGSTEQFEKFAELIVRECSLFVFKQNGPKSALNLLEHFGVEE